MWARCFSSRRTRPFSAMIWSSFRTVVYCVGLRAPMVSCTSRTVLGPRLHKMVRISSSASVGRGRSGVGCFIYENVTTNAFVVSIAFFWSLLFHQFAAADGGTIVFVVAGIPWLSVARSDSQMRTGIVLIFLAPVLRFDQPFPQVVVFRGADDVFGFRRQDLLDLFLGVVDALRIGGMGSQHFGDQPGLRLLQRHEFFEDADRAVRIVPCGVHVLHSQIVGLSLIGAAEACKQRLHADARSLANAVTGEIGRAS